MDKKLFELMEKVDKKIILNKFASKTDALSVKEATVILQAYGLSASERRTRELISRASNPLKGQMAKAGDRREGYKIERKDLYDFIISEIPIMKTYFDILVELDKQRDNEIKGQRKKPKSNVQVAK